MRPSRFKRPVTTDNVWQEHCPYRHFQDSNKGHWKRKPEIHRITQEVRDVKFVQPFPNSIPGNY